MNNCLECGAVIVLGRFVYTSDDDLDTVICFSCYGEIPKWAV